MSTATTVERALCATCGSERTVKMGGPRNYFPPGWNYETQSGNLKCDGCGGIRRHAVVRDHSSSAYFQARYAAIKSMVAAESAGIKVERVRFEVERDGCVAQRLDTGQWKIQIDSRLDPHQILEAMAQAQDYIAFAEKSRWWVRPDSHQYYPKRWLSWFVNGRYRAWHPSDPDVEL
ncbi:hypothetical protein [Tsukamurella sp. NPDC003166]|uniref:hypothetical protein n=1 Tax=Tsukamurella sp. NPDC003166 TaxID=3154444 RepID=UPI0033AEF1B4